VCDFIYFIFNGVQVVHRRVTGFCAGEEAISSAEQAGRGFSRCGMQATPGPKFPRPSGGCENLAKAVLGNGSGGRQNGSRSLALETARVSRTQNR
jgi:hypothetical protein